MINKIDFNKILLIAGIIFILAFCITVAVDYMSYNTYNNSAPFYTRILVRSIQFLIWGLLLIYLYNQNTYLKQTVYNIEVDKAVDVKGYKIAQISDFHNTNSTRLKNSIISALKSNKPDIIVITGDLIDSRKTNIACAKEFLERLIAITTTYYVLGNHESRNENIQEVIDTFSSTGVKILRDEKIKLQDGLELIGLDDVNFSIPEKEQKSLSTPQVTLKETLKHNLKSIHYKNDSCTVLITHRPEFLSTYAKCNIDIALTGHAHGGQVRLPIIGGLFAPGQGYFPRYTNGVHTKNQTTMVVSRGIGNSKFPFRFNNRPEIVFVNITIP